MAQPDTPLTPMRSIRARCLDCVGGHRSVIHECGIPDCPLHIYRAGRRVPEHGGLTPMKAVRAKCLRCCLGQRGEVRLCPASSCPLHPFRLGKRPVDSECESVRLPEESAG